MNTVNREEIAQTIRGNSQCESTYARIASNSRRLLRRLLLLGAIAVFVPSAAMAQYIVQPADYFRQFGSDLLDQRAPLVYPQFGYSAQYTGHLPILYAWTGDSWQVEDVGDFEFGLSYADNAWVGPDYWWELVNRPYGYYIVCSLIAWWDGAAWVDRSIACVNDYYNYVLIDGVWTYSELTSYVDNFDY